MTIEERTNLLLDLAGKAKVKDNYGAMASLNKSVEVDTHGTPDLRVNGRHYTATEVNAVFAAVVIYRVKNSLFHWRISDRSHIDSVAQGQTMLHCFLAKLKIPFSLRVCKILFKNYFDVNKLEKSAVKIK